MWYSVSNLSTVDTPALLVYPERIEENIALAVRMAGGYTDKLRPHVKTHKMLEITRMMLGAGIRKFKCATIAEAEMLAMSGAPDVLLAYQPVGPKVLRLLKLIGTYPYVHFSCLVDDEENARYLAYAAQQYEVRLNIFIDLNVGMNRTGIQPEKAPQLVEKIMQLENLQIVGLHSYDGHIYDTDLNVRKEKADQAFLMTERIYQQIQPLFPYPLVIVMGGTPTFPIHIHREHCECSPGTFVLWDRGYADLFPDQAFQYAALVITRVISIIDETHICIDLGYKSVAAESPLPRVYFLNAPEAIPEKQSEEHLVLAVPDSSQYALGDVFYGVPSHICPTVALYAKAGVIRTRNYSNIWDIIARNRTIKI